MRVAVDWDGTCIEDKWPSRYGRWLPGAIDGLRHLLDEGWSVTIHTCRIAPVLRSGRTRSASAVQREIHTIRRRLDKAGLHAVSIHTDPWKPSADVYLDNRGVAFTTWKEALSELEEHRLLGH